MAAINFPDTPVLNDEYTHPDTGTVYYWNGTQWRIKATGSSDIQKTVYYEETLTLPSDPSWKKVAVINLATVPTEVFTTIINIDSLGNLFSGKFYINRDINAANVIMFLNSGEVSSNIFYYVVDAINNVINIYVYNDNYRPTFVLWTTDKINIILADETSVIDALPPVDSIPILQDRDIHETELSYILNHLTVALNSMSDFIDDNVRLVLQNSEG